jgi:hypothetical protein
MRFKFYFFLFFIIMMVLLIGCTQMTNIQQKEKFKDINNAYRQAILWSDFEYASSFHESHLQNQMELDPIYKIIKVTAYDEKRHVINSDANHIEQTVDIQYYRIDQMLEKSIIFNPVWKWDTQSKNWYLISGMPIFK